jgi:uncharacterized protein involved in exopolysaccharide biosynthesis
MSVPVQATDERPTPLGAARRHWVLCAVLVIVGAGGAAGYVYSQPVLHSAEARLAVAGNDLSAQLVPAFAVATEELAANYARYLNTDGTEDTIAETIGAQAGSVTDIEASPIPESNILRIEATATTSEVAVDAAESLAADLMTRVNESRLQDNGAQEALNQYTNLSNEVATAEQAVLDITTRIDLVVGGAAGNIADLRGQLAGAQSRLDVLSVQQEALGERYRALVSSNTGTAANLDLVRPADSTGDDRATKLQRYGLLGVAVGGALGIALATLLERRRRHSRAAPVREPEPAGPAEEPDSAEDAAAGDDPHAQDGVRAASRSPASTH